VPVGLTLSGSAIDVTVWMSMFSKCVTVPVWERLSLYIRDKSDVSSCSCGSMYCAGLLSQPPAGAACLV
jgi:hypothetical protein